MQLLKVAAIQKRIYRVGVFTAGDAWINSELFLNNPRILYLFFEIIQTT